MTRVFLVDDHELVRRGIASLIGAERDLEVVGESGTVHDTLPRIAATQPDVVLLDVRMPDGSGIDLCRDIRSQFPYLGCLILTAYDDDAAQSAAVLAGAAGYVLKTVRGSGLLDSIRRVALGETLIPTTVMRRVASSLAPRGADVAGADGVAPEQRRVAAQLGSREREVLALITRGLTNRQIGESLGISEKTVKNHVSHLFVKLGVERRTQAAVLGASLDVTLGG
jgi:two-component system, NarL family, response regulator DevR